MKMPYQIEQFLCDEEGSVALEYSLVAAVIGIGALVSLASFRTAIGKLIAAIVAKLAV